MRKAKSRITRRSDSEFPRSRCLHLPRSASSPDSALRARSTAVSVRVAKRDQRGSDMRDIEDTSVLSVHVNGSRSIRRREPTAHGYLEVIPCVDPMLQMICLYLFVSMCFFPSPTGPPSRLLPLLALARRHATHKRRRTAEVRRNSARRRRARSIGRRCRSD